VDERQVAGWVWPSNVKPLLSMTSHYIGYRFDDWDWQAIAAALPATDDDREDGWYEYPLVGVPPLRVRLAQAVGAVPVMVTVAGQMDEVLAARISTLLDVLAEVEHGG
jgi:hypothetical protein